MLLGVAGHPVGHSRSPTMHNAALAAMGLDGWLYIPLPLDPPRFTEAVPRLAASGFRGINATVPHKQDALAVATESSEAASATGAANTLTFGDDGSIAAENTDASALVELVGDDVAGRRALVLGAGGSARAAVWALHRAGAASVGVWNRTAQRGRALAQELGGDWTPTPADADVLVNCTSVGLPGTAAGLEDLPLGGLATPPALVIDLVYAERRPPVSAWALERGSRLVDGLEVLVAQGARSLESWTGEEVPRDVMAESLHSGRQST